MVQRKKVTRAKAPARVSMTGEARQALTEVADAIAQLRAEDVLRVNVDIARSVSIVLGAEPQLLALAEQIETALPEHDGTSITNLQTYALAALYAHLESQPAPASSDLSDLLAEAAPLKQTLVVAAEALAHAGLVDGDRLGEIKRGTGHLDLAADLVALSALLDVAWAQVEGKTFVTPRDVERAAQIGTELLVLLGAKNHAASRATPEAVDRRNRAFTLLYRTYDEARRALTYLRWHEDDVDLIAPSLYKRVRRRATVTDGSPEQTDTQSTQAGVEVTGEQEKGADLP